MSNIFFTHCENNLKDTEPIDWYCWKGNCLSDFFMCLYFLDDFVIDKRAVRDKIIYAWQAKVLCTVHLVTKGKKTLKFCILK